jgi:hypothetical protein
MHQALTSRPGTNLNSLHISKPCQPYHKETVEQFLSFSNSHWPEELRTDTSHHGMTHVEQIAIKDDIVARCAYTSP